MLVAYLYLQMYTEPKKIKGQYRNIWTRHLPSSINQSWVNITCRTQSAVLILPKKKNSNRSSSSSRQNQQDVIQSKHQILEQLKAAISELPLKALGHVILCKNWTKKVTYKNQGKMHITSQGGNFYGVGPQSESSSNYCMSHKKIVNQNLGEEPSCHISCSLLFFQLSPLSHRQHMQVHNHSYSGELLKHLASGKSWA
jgi:hypothetical protein